MTGSMPTAAPVSVDEHPNWGQHERGHAPGMRVALRPGDVQNGLGKLVLTLVELIRQLLERQAVRRIEAGSLTDEEIERLGLTFLQLSEQIAVLREQFGLEDDDLNLDLGPLGKLL
ncbi:MAG: gas vesicle protein K [Isosphaeraceae bacterium]